MPDATPQPEGHFERVMAISRRVSEKYHAAMMAMAEPERYDCCYVCRYYHTADKRCAHRFATEGRVTTMWETACGHMRCGRWEQNSATTNGGQ